MSPRTLEAALALEGFPRVSGDEPFDGQLAALIAEFSPRERG